MKQASILAVVLLFGGSEARANPVWTETFDNGVGRFDETLLLGDSLFAWDNSNHRIQAEFRRNGASDRRATSLGTTLDESDVFGFSVVVTPLDRNPGSTLSIEGKIGFFNSNNNNIENAIGIVVRDGFQRFRLFGPGIDAGFRPVAWERFHTYFLEFLFDGPSDQITWSVYEGTTAQGIHLGTFVENSVPTISVDMLGLGGDGGSLVPNSSYAGFLRAEVDDFSLTVPEPSLIYWTDRGSGKIQRSNLDGSCVQDIVTGLLSGPDHLSGIAFDPTTGKIYWTGSRPTPMIRRANLDGSNIEDLYTSQGGPPFGIALDVVVGKMYWADAGTTDKIQRADLDGSNVEVLVSGLVGPRGVGLDLTRGKMYWADLGFNTTKIQRANLDGADVENIVNNVIAFGVAVDALDGKLYWTEFGNGIIKRADLTGSNIETLVSGLASPHGIALDSAQGKMYWADATLGKIQRADLDGSDVEDLVTGLSLPTGIAIVTLPMLVDCNGNGIPDECETDSDGDGMIDECDNCRSQTNSAQQDSDGDGVGDVCDNCRDLANTDQADADGDGIGNACDNCRSQTYSAHLDSDGDCIGDVCDNCRDLANTNQVDTDGNGIGDACEDESEGQPVQMEECGDGCGAAGMMMMPLTLLGIGWLKRRDTLGPRR